jgi:hypothetical protein
MENLSPINIAWEEVDFFFQFGPHLRMTSGIQCLKRNRKNSHQQPPPGSLGKTGRAKAGVNIPLSQ